MTIILGIQNEAFDDSRSNASLSVSSSSPSSDNRTLEQGATKSVGGSLTNDAKIINGASEILGLLRILGEGYRLSCLFRCQVSILILDEIAYTNYSLKRWWKKFLDSN